MTFLQAEPNILSFALECIHDLFNTKLVLQGYLDVVSMGRQEYADFKPCNDTVILSTTSTVNITLQHHCCQCGIEHSDEASVPLVSWHLDDEQQVTCLTYGFTPGANTIELMHQAGMEAFYLLGVACSLGQPAVHTGDVTVWRAWSWTLL